MKIKNCIWMAGFVLLALLTACTDDACEPAMTDKEVTTDQYTHIRLQLEVEKPQFEGDTRAPQQLEWEDGDGIFLAFNGSNGVLPGTATYVKSKNEWEMTILGQERFLLEESSVKVYAAEDFVQEGDVSGDVALLRLNCTKELFGDESGQYKYKKEDGKVSVSAKLKPMTSRIRFKGSVGASMMLKGIAHYDTYDLTKGVFEKSSDAVILSVQPDGYTPYVYCSFADSGNPNLVVTTGICTFTATGTNGLLAIGHSGWLTIPTAESHNGWEMTGGVESNDLIKIDVGGVSFNMIRVEAGTFDMGATGEQTGFLANETPAHRVTLTRDYYIGETEVTQALWQAVMGETPTSTQKWDDNAGVGATRPCYYVNYSDCEAFIAKLNEKTGRHFRMPTEAEWEYAARGGNKSQGYTYSGGNNAADVGWFKTNAYDVGKGTDYGTHAVATREPNELGLYDMSGNVYEWCSDWYGSYGSENQTDPTGATGGSYRVARGGSWDAQSTCCRNAYRMSMLPAARRDNVGFRLALFEEPAKLTFTAGGVSFSMIKVEAGTFQMGSTVGESNEQPVHSVTITKDYYIGETEVTQALWKAVTGYSPTADGDAWYTNRGLGNDYPAYFISYNDVQSFLTKLNSMAGMLFRMPTEAEWEYAARGGNRSKGYIYSGSNSLDDVAWYTYNSGSKTHPVKTKAPNELGLYDMSGNVWEWCSDRNGGYSSGAQMNPTGPTNGSYRVCRGGSWDRLNYDCRVARRRNFTPYDRNYGTLGVRLALSE